jgi:hypothetical protein
MHCHCEERSDVAISITKLSISLRLPRPSAEELAMTTRDMLKFAKLKEALCQKQR